MKANEIGQIGKLFAEVPGSLGQIYQIRLSDSGKDWTCSCLGFKASKSKPHQCKHLREIWYSLKESIED